MGRTYQIDDKKYPSVTSILDMLDKPALVQWSANCVVEYVRDHLDDIRNGVITADDIDLDRARLDSTLVLGSAHIGSLFDLIVAATQLFELGGGFATGHLALRVSKGRCLASAVSNQIVTSTQPLALGAAKAVLD